MTVDEIITQLQSFVGAENIEIGREQLEESSIDLYRKWEQAQHEFNQITPPIAIVYITNVAQVQQVLRFADENKLNVIPRTGGSDIERGLETGGKEPHFILDGSRMNQILKVDPTNMQVTVEAGVSLQVLEDNLNKMGYTTGHSPQSKPITQIGGLIATRSIGQYSTLYGGIEDMVAGLAGVLPDGTTFDIKPIPRRAAGPDIRQIFIGSEGTIAFITQATLKMHTWQPDNNIYLGWAFDDLAAGFKILRDVMVAGYRPSMARVYEAGDAALHFADFVHEQHVLLFMAEGPANIAQATADGIRAIVAANAGFTEFPGQHVKDWLDHLNWDNKRVNDERIYFAKTHQVGYTTEIAAGWSEIVPLFMSVQTRVMQEVAGMIGISGHSSHQYINGTNMYFIYGYWMDKVNATEITVHDQINRIIVEETLKHAGTIVHHHGIGKARAPYIQEEYGTSYPVLKKLLQAFDPHNTMNAGSIIPIDLWNKSDQ
ncbi:FAD-binding oxidoreductase [Loigolactobacillus zhaoyuanensis]|uniref:FAD-binding oxidoreductase n=1 Tax=Loigolactobacillus zhaoyuanensis TaxID=2486017 RepID=UPI001CDB933E|nr:FAD-binding oxidoreductase [Loigolactobacillus zhaoyuanensis]